MRNIVLTLIMPFFAGLAFSVNAAPVSAVEKPLAVVSQNLAASGQLNLNRVDAMTLQRELNGIGKAKAEAVVAYREANGPFASVDELLEIKGIGEALLERNRDKLMVD